MNRPDAIFTDLDGTLLGPDKKVGTQDAAAIRRLKELGIPVIICTGRPILGTRLVTAELGLGLTLCSNGGCCHDFIRDETLLAVEMDHGVARRLLAWLEEEGEPFLLHAPKQIFGSPGAQMPPHYVLQGEESGGTIFHDSPFDGLQILKVLEVRCDEADGGYQGGRDPVAGGKDGLGSGAGHRHGGQQQRSVHAGAGRDGSCAGKRDPGGQSGGRFCDSPQRREPPIRNHKALLPKPSTLPGAPRLTAVPGLGLCLESEAVRSEK